MLLTIYKETQHSFSSMLGFNLCHLFSEIVIYCCSTHIIKFCQINRTHTLLSLFSDFLAYFRGMIKPPTRVQWQAMPRKRKRPYSASDPNASCPQSQMISKGKPLQSVRKGNPLLPGETSASLTPPAQAARP